MQAPPTGTHTTAPPAPITLLAVGAAARVHPPGNGKHHHTNIHCAPWPVLAHPPGHCQHQPLLRHPDLQGSRGRGALHRAPPLLQRPAQPMLLRIRQEHGFLHR